MAKLNGKIYARAGVAPMRVDIGAIFLPGASSSG